MSKVYGQHEHDGPVDNSLNSLSGGEYSAIMNDGQKENMNRINAWRYPITILFIILITLLFFRSILPRIPRLFLRGRLRVRRIGLRGIRGIEWRSKGFKSETASRKSYDNSLSFQIRPSLASDDTEGTNDDGLGIKIRHIYLKFKYFSEDEQNLEKESQQVHLPENQEGHQQDLSDGSSSYVNPRKACDKQSSERKRAWITLHIDGIGVNLPRKDQAEEEKKKRLKKEKKITKELEAERKQEEEEEQHLEALMLSRPSSPRPDTNTNASPMPAFSAAMGRAPREASRSYSNALPLRSWSQVIAFIQSNVLPLLYLLILRIIRSLAYLILSLLPLLSRVIDVEVRKVEVYAAEQDVVLRVHEIDLGVHMDVVPARGLRTNAGTEGVAIDSEKRSISFQERLAYLFSMVHFGLGSGARGAASIALDGLPGLHANLRIALQGLQLFDAERARQIHHPKRDSSIAGSEDRSFNFTPPNSSFTLNSAQEHQWQSFANFQNASSPNQTNSSHKLHKATSESNLFTESNRFDSRRRWAGRWSDWALEKTPDANFIPHTSWDQDDPECRLKPIANHARLLAMHDLSTLKIGFVLGKAVSAKDSLHLHFGFAPITVGADAFVSVVERVSDQKIQKQESQTIPSHEYSQDEKRISSAPSPKMVKLLEMFGSVAVCVPSFLIDLSSKTSFAALSSAEETSENDDGSYLPSSVQMVTELKQFTLYIKTSRLPDAMHQNFLGTCGVKGHKAAMARKALSDGLRWTLGRRRTAFVEHRRTFALSASISQINVRLGIDGNKSASKLMKMADLSVAIRSSWTPVGLLVTGPPHSCFKGDPNEQVIVVDAKMASLKGDVQVEHICSLLAFFRYRQAERNKYRQEIGIAQMQSKNKNANQVNKKESLMRQLPRFVIGVELSEISYRIDVSELLRVGTEKPILDLIFEVPKISFNTEGIYQDQCIRRSESERKAAWKALEKDELEWSIKPNLKATGEPGSSPASVLTQSPKLGGGYFEWRRGSLSGITPRTPGEVETPGVSFEAGKQSLTMEEALKEMQKIQERDEQKKNSTGKAHNRSTSTSSRKKTSNQPNHNERSSTEFPTHHLRWQSNFTFDQIKLYWIMDGHDFSSQRRARDGEDRFPAFIDQIPSRGRTHRHILALNDFEASSVAVIPARQDLKSDQVTLLRDRRSIDVRMSLEEVDLDMWHTTSLDATRACLKAFRVANTKIRLSEFDIEEKDDQQSKLQAESDSDHSVPPLIDLLKPNSSLYFSVGAIVAHVGGSDPRCDPGMFRGIGLDLKRAILQIAVAKLEPRRTTDYTHFSMGARSALDLDEDQRSSVNALAVRYGKAASAKLSLFQLGVFPLLDAQMATAQHVDSGAGRRSFDGEDEDWKLDMEEVGSPSIIAPAVWEFQRTRPQHTKTHRIHAKFRQQDRNNFIVWIPKFAIRANLLPKTLHANRIGKHMEELQISTEGVDLLSLKVELLHTYCVLVAIAALKSLKPTLSSSENPKKNFEPGKQKKRRFQMPSYYFAIRLSDIHIAVDLPNEVKLFLLLQHIEFIHAHHGDSSIGFERLMCAVESPEVPSKGNWEELSRWRDCKVRLERPTDDGTPLRVKVNVDGVNLRVPFNYTVHPIIDSTVVAVKTTKQLIHQFIKGGNDSVIIPVAEGPKHLPIVDVSIRIFAIEAEDDPFETRLNIIWRSGGDENQARSERDSAFQEKMHALENLRTNDRSQESLSSMTGSFSDSDGEDEKLRRQAKVNFEEARYKLDAFNASSWIRRYGNAKAEQSRREESNVRSIYGRLPAHSVLQSDLPIKLSPRSRAAPLIRSTMTKLHIVISPPSFPESKLRDFLYEQGDKIPRDMEYSILVPLHMKLRVDEWKITLRDYPMPLLHFPPINRATQADTLAAVEMEMDFCIAEQLGREEAIRHVSAIVVPAATGKPDAVEYGISVPRMSMPTKFFGSPVININSSYPTRLVWGQSVQPAIHDVARVFEGITSPPHDPSPRLGFWDKLSMVLHGQLKFQFPGDGQFHVYLKGSRDPYHILGQGAGWVKCWRGNVELRLGFENPQKEIFQILSDEYILAIPDLKDYIDRAATGTERRESNAEEESNPDKAEQQSSQKHTRTGSGSGDLQKYGKRTPTLASSIASSGHRYMRDPEFRKVCLKLTNGVRWGWGLILERTCTDETCENKPPCRGAAFYRHCRFWTRKPHWQVYTKSHEYVNSLPQDQHTDSYEGWRSQHLHFSISIDSPRDRNAGKGEGIKNGVKSRSSSTSSSKASSDADSNAVNNLYFTPLAWEHFWAWMRLFDSTLSLPIRQGKLFPGSLEQSPKFGRHIGTIKYHFNIAPLFISHLYPQANKTDWARGRTTLIGIKARMSSFHMDFHQRQQEIVVDRPELGGQRKKFHKPFYEAEVDLAQINFRTLAGQFQEPNKRLIPMHDMDDNEDNEHDNIFGDEDGDDERRTPPDRDLEWYDLNDFVELDWAPPEGGKQPRIRLIEAMNCPRFSYYRRIESKDERLQRTKGTSEKESPEDNIETAKLENTKFGHEKTHVCLVGGAPAPPKVQIVLAEKRLQVLREQLEKYTKKVKEGGSFANSCPDGKAKTEAEKSKGTSVDIEHDLHRKMKLVRDYIKLLNQIQHKFFDHEKHPEEPEEHAQTSDHINALPGSGLTGNDALHEWQAFDNRYFIHNPIIFYSNATRDVLLKYYLSSRKRRGVVHSLSARAVRYIRNLGQSDETEKSSRAPAQRMRSNLTVQTQSTTGTKGTASSSSSTTNGEHPFHKLQATSEQLDGILKEAEYMMPEKEEGEDAADDNKSKNGQDDKNTWREEAKTAYAALMETCHPEEGISDEFEVGRSNVCVVLKPQIVLRSLVDDKSTVIITASRARLRNYSVKDPRVEEDSVNERVLYRNFVGVDALQAFHPSEKCTFTNRARGTSNFVYVPLENLVDFKHETSDFDRITPRTDAHVQYDKFNKLRLNDPNHPVAAPSSNKTKEENSDDGEKLDQHNHQDHLRHTMDLIRVRCPRYSISANAEQFGAIYNVVTDLLLYRDPAHREHAKKLEVMMFSYDLSDVEALADLVQSLQIRIRHAKELHAQYQLHFDHLNEQGKLDFLALKAEINDMQDELNLLLEAITQADDHSDKEKKSALRLEAKAKDVAWNMMGDREGELLAKMSINNANFTWMNKADNSVINSLSVGNLNAFNADQNAVFHEIITKYNSEDHHPMKENGMLLVAAWSVLPPVGGIAIVDKFELHLHPLRIQIERKIGRKIEEYIFGSMREKRKEREEQEDNEQDQKGEGTDRKFSERSKIIVTKRFKQLKDAVRGHSSSNSNSTKNGISKGENEEEEGVSPIASGQSSPRKSVKPLPPSSRRSIDNRRSMTLHRTSSRSLMSNEDRGRTSSFYSSGHHNNSQTGGISGKDGENGKDGGQSDDESDEESGQRAIASRNAVEMRSRASRTVTFVSVKVSQTIFCLSYKSEKQKSIVDLYDLVFRSPRLEYRNRTWAHADLAHHLKRDIFKAAWSQKSSLIKGVISQRRPPATQRVAQAAMTLSRSRHQSPNLININSHSPTAEVRNALTGAIEYPLKKAASLASSSSAKRTASAGYNGANTNAVDDEDEYNEEFSRTSSGNRSNDQKKRRQSSSSEFIKNRRKSFLGHDDSSRISTSSDQRHTPEFRLQVDPPSFSTSGSHGSMASSGA